MRRGFRIATTSRIGSSTILPSRLGTNGYASLSPALRAAHGRPSLQPSSRGLTRTPNSRGYATEQSSDQPSHSDIDISPSDTGSNLPASTDLLEVYRGLVAQGRLRWDEEQVRVVMKAGLDPEIASRDFH
jgi:hypothetical protein